MYGKPGSVSLDDVRKIEVEVAASLAATNNAYLKELLPPQPSPFVGMVPLNEGQLKGKRIRTDEAHLEVGRIGASSGDSLVDVVGLRCEAISTYEHLAVIDRCKRIRYLFVDKKIWQ